MLVLDFSYRYPVVSKAIFAYLGFNFNPGFCLFLCKTIFSVNFSLAFELKSVFLVVTSFG